MAREIDHISLANKNHAALRVLVPLVTEHPEWVATIAFYKAVQIVEAVLVKTKNGPSSDHKSRRHAIRYKLKDLQLLQHYVALLNASKVARYLVDSDGRSYRQFSDLVHPDKVVDKLLKGRLIPVEQLASKYLSESMKKLERTDPLLCEPA